MIDLSSNTYSNILQSQLNQVPADIDKREDSLIYTALGISSYALEDFYMVLNIVQQQAFLQTASGQSLDYLTALAGVQRQSATAAIRLGIFNVAVPIGARFTAVNGTDSINYTVTAATTTQYQYQLTAETLGSIGNNYSGVILPITTIPNLTSAQMTTVLVPGEDTESDESLLARAIAALLSKPFGGNVASYRENILGINGVGAVQVYPTWNGGGTVKCSVLDADFNAASSTLLATIQTAIDPTTGQSLGYGLAPIGAAVTIVAPSDVTVNITATVTLASGYVIDQVQPQAETAVQNYLLSVRKSWGDLDGSGLPNYTSDVYLSRIISVLLTVPGIVNVTNVQINGAATDLLLTQSGTTQQIPVFGAVSLSV